MTPAHTSELCRLWREDHDEAAIGELVNAYAPLVRSLTRRATRNTTLPGWLAVADIEAACNEALVLAAGAYDPSRGANFQTYARYKIRGALHHAMDRVYRKKRSGDRQTISLDTHFVNGDGYEALHERIESRPLVTPLDFGDVQEAVDRLPERQRDILTRLYVRGETHIEAAGALGVSRAAVCYHETRALLRLKRRILP